MGTSKAVWRSARLDVVENSIPNELRQKSMKAEGPCDDFSFVIQPVEIPDWVPVLGGTWGGSLESLLCISSCTCTPEFTGGLSVNLNLGSYFTLAQQQGSVTARWRTHYVDGLCFYVPDSLNLRFHVSDAKGSIPIKIKLPKKWEKLLSVDAAVQLQGDADGDLSWFGPWNEVPDKGSVRLTLDGDIHGKCGIRLGGDFYEAGLTGKAHGTLLYAAPATWNGNLDCVFIEIAVPGLPDPIRIPLYGPCANEPKDLRSMADLQETDLRPLVFSAYARGTGNVYSGKTVASDVSQDFFRDGAPSISCSPNGTVQLVWTKSSPDPATSIGSSVLVSKLTGEGWSSTEEIAPCSEFNSGARILFRSDASLLAVWIRAPGNLTIQSSLEEIMAALEQSDVYFSEFRDTSWSTPRPITSMPGADHSVRIAAGPM
jgi:hypothetical protein